MHDAVAILERAAETEDPALVFTVTQKAIAYALKAIMRADDSSGIIGDACRALLDLHPEVAARAKPSVAKLVDWMIKFQFHSECDYFTLDLGAYAPPSARSAWPATEPRSPSSKRASAHGRPTMSGGRLCTATTGSRSTGTPSGGRCWTAMSRRSSARTPATGRWPRGCRPPPKRWRRSASSTSRSTGPARRSI